MRKWSLALVVLLIHAVAARAENVTGRVLGTDGGPVAGARVVLERYSVADGERDYSTGESGPDGKFSIELKPLSGKNNPGTAVAYKPGAAVARLRWQIGQAIELRLQPGTTATGIVKDSNGKPVAGANVQLEHVLMSSSEYMGYDPWDVTELLQTAFAVKTDAAGRWTMADLPVKGRAAFQVRDKRFFALRTAADLGETPVEVDDIEVLPAAGITGRVVFESGEPVANAQVSASAGQFGKQSWGTGKSAADGTYRIDSLAAGRHALFVQTRDQEWLLLKREEVVAKAGQTVAAPRLVLTHGAFVQGQVTDAKSGEPIPQVRIASDIGGKGGLTGADGRYRLRVAPGKQGIYIMMMARGYLQPKSGSPSSTVTMTFQKNETKTLDLALEKGLVVSGVTVDEAGQPVSNARILLRIANRFGSPDFGQTLSSRSDEQGKWQIVGVRPDRYGFAVDGDWIITNPHTFNAAGAAPQRVVLRHQEAFKAVGKVRTQDGTIVAGAKVSAEVLVPEGGGGFLGHHQDLKSDANGQFVVQGLRPDYQVRIEVGKPGYRYLSGGKVTKDEKGFTVEDILLQPQTARIAGTVLSADGAPVAGAIVTAPDAGGGRTATDVQGNFTLDNLTEGEATVVVAHPSGAATARRKTGPASYRFTLQAVTPPSGIDVKKAQEILHDVWETSRGGNDYLRSEIPLLLSQGDAEAALRMMRGTDGKTSDTALSVMLNALAEKAPVDNAEFIVAHADEIKEPYTRLLLFSNLATSITAAKPELATTIYEKAQRIAIPADYSMRRYQPVLLAAVAARLGRQDDATKWFRQGLALLPSEQAVADEDGITRNGTLEVVAEVAARGSATLAEWAVGTIDEKATDTRLEALARAVSELVKYDLPAAQKFLQQMKEINGDQASHASDALIITIIDALGPQDAQAALALARTVESEDIKPQALMQAAAFLPKESALEVLKEAAQAAEDKSGVLTYMLSQIGGRAYRLDTATGAAILGKAKARLQANIKNHDPSFSYWRIQSAAQEVGVYAFYASAADPVETRLMIEEEFAYLNQQVPADRRYSQADDLILAMATLDVERARELARQIHNGGLSSQFAAEIKIAEFLLTEPEKRGKLLLQR